MTAPAPFLSVIVPTRGDPGKLANLLAALEGQSLPRDRYEVLVAFDGVEPHPLLDARLKGAGIRAVRLAVQSGPGAARNRGAAEARGEFLAFTEDDVTPAPDWLERAAERLTADPALDAIEGETRKPGGRPVRTLAADGPTWLPTNLFVRRAVFQRLGGYHEEFFDRATGVYFREDSDFGFTLEEAGALVARAPEVRVEHPVEHAGFLDPLRWAARYEMDALLAARHPRLFRERIEVHRLGPFRIRRPIVRAASAYVAVVYGALLAAGFGRKGIALALGLVALVAFLPIWAKWRFHPARLPVALLAPFGLVGALVRGWWRATSRRSRPGTRAGT